MKKILAVSGGVDSMVMLDLMRKHFPASELVVATFDHGTRESSSTDAEFVERVAEKLGIKAFKGKASLGSGVNEEMARQKRYEFLRKIAEQEKGEIYTAHHLDDLVESVAINLTRGTGPRGLAALNAVGIHRPFIDGTFDGLWDKQKILENASENGIVFRQDPTNTEDIYLRNRLREKLKSAPNNVRLKVLELWQTQKSLYAEIDKLVNMMIPEDLKFQREFFRNVDEQVALEILRAALIRANTPATRPQIYDFYKAILNYAPSKKFNLPNDRLVTLKKKDFQLKVC